ncbi:DUF4430 domain-containing protein [Paucisalibacillus sp. EB02]|uniref:DUF4430 domain-containing protein n=1 Tax=Paucisalibacillus sp. EB02 TaxID=1347087 RepID=UPI000693567F|nr:DUF4430 domain-containing protein [Paucisalibacillus sp. EB02]
MSNWLKRLSLIVSIFLILIVVGCSSSINMPLSKEEASQLASSQEEGANLSTALEQEEAPLADDTTPSKKNDNLIESEVMADDASNKDAEESNTSMKQHNEPSNNKAETKSKKETTKEQQAESTNEAKSSEKKTDKNTSTKKENKQDNTKKESNTSSENNKSESEPNNTETESNPLNTIVYSIVISESTNEIPLPPTEMEIEEGDTVLQALINITKEKRIQMDYRGGQGATAYVEGIANVYEFDRGQGSGWMYRVNGIFPDRGAGVVPLLPGDRVEWLYTTNLGVDLGADLKPFRR